MNDPKSEWPNWLDKKAKKSLADYIAFMGENPRYCFDDALEIVEFPLSDSPEGTLYMTSDGILLRRPWPPMKIAY